MPHARLMIMLSVLALVPASMMGGCGSGTASNGGDDDGKPAADSGADIGQPSTNDSGGASCVDAGPADDRPACNDCAYAHCCKQIDDCASDPQCIQLTNCEAACAPDDVTCLFTCGSLYDPSSLQAIAACAQLYCSTECPAPVIDAGTGGI
ncbi:MAG: hypothetical protein ABI332_05475 [Polyangiaceae bacterium]